MSAGVLRQLLLYLIGSPYLSAGEHCDKAAPPPPRLQIFVSAGEYYDNTTSTWVVDSYVYTMDLTLTANLAWRKVSSGLGEALVECEPAISVDGAPCI